MAQNTADNTTGNRRSECGPSIVLWDRRNERLGGSGGGDEDGEECWWSQFSIETWNFCDSNQRIQMRQSKAAEIRNILEEKIPRQSLGLERVTGRDKGNRENNRIVILGIMRVVRVVTIVKM